MYIHFILISIIRDLNERLNGGGETKRDAKTKR